MRKDAEFLASTFPVFEGRLDNMVGKEHARCLHTGYRTEFRIFVFPPLSSASSSVSSPFASPSVFADHLRLVFHTLMKTVEDLDVPIRRRFFSFEEFTIRCQELIEYAHDTELLDKSAAHPDPKNERTCTRLASLRSAHGIADTVTVKVVKKFSNADSWQAAWVPTEREQELHDKATKLKRERQEKEARTWVLRKDMCGIDPNFDSEDVFDACQLLHPQLVYVWQHGYCKSAKAYLWLKHTGTKDSSTRFTAHANPTELLVNAAIYFLGRKEDTPEKVFNLRTTQRNSVKFKITFVDDTD
jgi:hypothetical protein